MLNIVPRNWTTIKKYISSSKFDIKNALYVALPIHFTQLLEFPHGFRP